MLTVLAYLQPSLNSPCANPHAPHALYLIVPAQLLSTRSFRSKTYCHHETCRQAFPQACALLASCGVVPAHHLWRAAAVSCGTGHLRNNQSQVCQVECSRAGCWLCVQMNDTLSNQRVSVVRQSGQVSNQQSAHLCAAARGLQCADCARTHCRCVVASCNAAAVVCSDIPRTQLHHSHVGGLSLTSACCAVYSVHTAQMCWRCRVSAVAGSSCRPR